MGFNLPGDLSARREDRFDREAGRGAKLVERVKIKGIARGDTERAVLPLEREQRVAMDQLEWEAAEERQVDFLLLEIDKRDADFVAERSKRGFFANQPKIHGRHIEAR